jgi:iron(III) transport system permease protein
MATSLVGSLRASSATRRLVNSVKSASPVALVGLVFVALAIPPIITVVTRSFYTTDLQGNAGTFTLENYSGLLSQSRLSEVLLNTAAVSLGATVLAIVVGGGLAWVAERTNAPGARACQFAMLLSLSIPYVLYSIAWIMLLGPTGPANRLMAAVLGAGHTVIKPYSLAGMVLVEGLIATPLAFLLLSAVFRMMDPSLEETASMCGASGLRIFLRVSAPLALPGIVGVGLLIFIRTLEAFEIPALIGLPGHITVLTTSIYQDTEAFPPHYGSAGAYAVLLMFAVSGLLIAAHRLTKRSSAFATVTGKGFRPKVTQLGRWRFVGTAAVTVYCLVGLALPFAIVAWASFMPFYTAPALSALHRVTLQNYATVLSQPQFLTSFRNTIVVGILSATVVMLLTTIASWLSLKRRATGSSVLEQLAGLPLVVPGVIMGFSIAALYLSVPVPVYGTLWILVIGYATRYLPYGMRYSGAGLIQVHSELEEAAAVSGASTARGLRSVLLPLASPALLAGWIFIFLVASKELSMSVLLSSPDTEVLPVTLYHQWINGQTTQTAALGTLWTLVLGGLTIAFLLLGRRRGLRMDM